MARKMMCWSDWKGDALWLIPQSQHPDSNTYGAFAHSYNDTTMH